MLSSRFLQTKKHNSLTRCKKNNKRKSDGSDQTSSKRIKINSTSKLCKKEKNTMLTPSIQVVMTCPITNQTFHDPVVYKNGKSYERKALTGYQEGIDYSPNRILKEIIQAINDNNLSILPDLLECPIHLERMINPLILITQDGGQSFDKQNDILTFINEKQINPLNNLPLTEYYLVDNLNLKKFIQAYVSFKNSLQNNPLQNNQSGEKNLKFHTNK